MDLKKEWLQLATRYTPDQSLATKLWQELVQAYTASGRHYHNLQHIEELIRLAGLHQATIKDPDAMRLAIFYHDAVYHALRKDNEEKSALLAMAKLQQLSLPPARLQHIYEMILATKNHTACPDADTNLLLDFDLSILGSSWEQYQAYSRQVRKEYSLVPYFLYKRGRKKVLEHFLGLPRIYKTEIFFQQLEAAARQNLAQELQLL